MYIVHENNTEISSSGVCCWHARKWTEI